MLLQSQLPHVGLVADLLLGAGCSLVLCCLHNSHYTPGIYAVGYIVFALTFVRSYVRSFVRVFVRSLLSVTFVEFTSKFLVKVSLSGCISLTTHQKTLIFEPWVPERVSFYTMSICPRVDAPGWG